MVFELSFAVAIIPIGFASVGIAFTGAAFALSLTLGNSAKYAVYGVFHLRSLVY